MYVHDFPLASCWLDDGVRPARPQLGRAQALARPRDDAQAVWRALGQAGLLPRRAPGGTRLFRWLGPEARDGNSREFGRLIPNMDGGAPARQRYFVTDQEVPFSVEQAVLIAADAQGIEKAEAAAWEARQRLVPWNVSPPRRIVWRFISATEKTWQTPCSDVLNDLRIILTEAFDQAGHTISPYPLTGPEPPNRLLWQLAVKHGYRVPIEVEDPYRALAGGPPTVPSAVAGKRFGELLDPFEPLDSVRQLGYRLDAFTGEDIVLLVPPR